MELKLDRNLQEKRIFPAIDIAKSGTRREEDLLSEKERNAAWLIRREMTKSSNIEVTARLLNYMKLTKNNDEFLDVVIKNTLDRVLNTPPELIACIISAVVLSAGIFTIGVMNLFCTMRYI